MYQYIWMTLAVTESIASNWNINNKISDLVTNEIVQKLTNRFISFDALVVVFYRFIENVRHSTLIIGHRIYASCITNEICTVDDVKRNAIKQKLLLNGNQLKQHDLMHIKCQPRIMKIFLLYWPFLCQVLIECGSFQMILLINFFFMKFIFFSFKRKKNQFP